MARQSRGVVASIANVTSRVQLQPKWFQTNKKSIQKRRSLPCALHAGSRAFQCLPNAHG